MTLPHQLAPPGRDEVLALLSRHKDELRKFNVSSLGLFGSVARNEIRAGSDIDLLLRLDRPAGFFHLVRLQKFLEGILGAPVDLVLEDSLREEFREQVLKELILAA